MDGKQDGFQAIFVASTELARSLDRLIGVHRDEAAPKRPCAFRHIRRFQGVG
jgi:hypothetical protein